MWKAEYSVKITPSKENLSSQRIFFIGTLIIYRWWFVLRRTYHVHILQLNFPVLIFSGSLRLPWPIEMDRRRIGNTARYWRLDCLKIGRRRIEGVNGQHRPLSANNMHFIHFGHSEFKIVNLVLYSKMERSGLYKLMKVDWIIIYSAV